MCAQNQEKRGEHEEGREEAATTHARFRPSLEGPTLRTVLRRRTDEPYGYPLPSKIVYRIVGI